MPPAATAKEPKPEPTELGDQHLFLPDHYTVSSLHATLGGINVDVTQDHPLYGLVVEDEVDLVLRGVRVTGSKSTHKGEVTLILTGKDIDVLKPRGLPSSKSDGEEEQEEKG